MSSRNDQCRITGVKGISDAVRETISRWITPELITLLFAEYAKSSGKLSRTSFSMRVRNSDAWKRYARPNDPNGPGFLRKYYCKECGDKGVVDLHVITNADDSQIKYVRFHINGKMVYGGACNVPSTFFRQFEYQPTLVSAVTGSPVSAVAAFVPFTKRQLEKLAAEYEFGGSGAIDRMFEERV